MPEDGDLLRHVFEEEFDHFLQQFFIISHAIQGRSAIENRLLFWRPRCREARNIDGCRCQWRRSSGPMRDDFV
jgi:hypothetical protein